MQTDIFPALMHKRCAQWFEETHPHLRLSTKQAYSDENSIQEAALIILLATVNLLLRLPSFVNVFSFIFGAIEKPIWICTIA